MKRFLKILGVSMLVVAAIVALLVIIVAIQGGFSGKKKPVDNLTVFVDGVATNEVLVNNDFNVVLQFTPDDAQALDVKVTVNTYGKDVIASYPTRVTAGREFAVALSKDNDGNYKGGEAELTFESDNRMIRRTLKVMVDVELADNSIYYTSGSEGITYNETTNTYGITVSPSVVNKLKVNSSIDHSLNPRTGFVSFSGDLKNIANKKSYATITNEYDESVLSLINGTVTYDSKDYYAVNLQAVNSSRDVKVCSYTHRLYEIQGDFADSWFTFITSSKEGDTFAQVTEYNAFINKYLKYFNKTEEARLFFEAHTREVEVTIDGETVAKEMVVFNADDVVALKQSLKYVLVNVETQFVVADIQIGGFTKANNVNVSVLNPYSVDTTTIASATDGWGLKINPASSTASDEDRTILQTKMGQVDIATYVLYLTGNVEPGDDKDDIVDGHNKYVFIDNKWYVYNTDYASITKATSEGVTSWTLTPYYPNYKLNEYITALNRVYVVYAIDNIDADAVVTTIRDLSELRVNYNPNPIAFANTVDKDQRIVVTSLKTGEGEQDYYHTYAAHCDGVNTTGTFSANDVVHTMADVTSEYTKVLWYLAYDTNYSADSDHLQIIKTRNTNATGASVKNEGTDIIDYLSNIDGTLFHVGDYYKWEYLGDSLELALEAINASTSINGLGNGGVRLYAMRMVTDADGNVLTRQIIVDGVGAVNARIVSVCVQAPIEISTTYMFTHEDSIYTYYIDDSDNYSRYESTTLEYVKGDNIELILSPFELVSSGDVKDNTYSIDQLHNLKIALFNYNNKLLYVSQDTSLQFNYVSAVGVASVVGPASVQSGLNPLDTAKITVTMSTQNSYAQAFNIGFTIMDAEYTCVKSVELFKEGTVHPKLFVIVKVNEN